MADLLPEDEDSPQNPFLNSFSGNTSYPAVSEYNANDSLSGLGSLGTSLNSSVDLNQSYEMDPNNAYIPPYVNGVQYHSMINNNENNQNLNHDEDFSGSSDFESVNSPQSNSDVVPNDETISPISIHTNSDNGINGGKKNRKRKTAKKSKSAKKSKKNKTIKKRKTMKKNKTMKKKKTMKKRKTSKKSKK
jgi:hypothetical protein